MKAERRHELKENDLAHLLDQLSEFLQKNGSRLGLAIVAVVVAVAVVGIAVRSRTAALEDAWQRKRSLSFETVADGQQSLQNLASLTAASTDRSFVFSGLLDQGRHALELTQKVPNPPDQDMNEKARAAFDELLAQFPANPLAFGAAHAGLATVEEMSDLVGMALVELPEERGVKLSATGGAERYAKRVRGLDAKRNPEIGFGPLYVPTDGEALLELEPGGPAGLARNGDAFYSTLPHLPPTVMRQIYLDVGVGLYVDTDDCVYADGAWFGIHSDEAGPRDVSVGGAASRLEMGEHETELLDLRTRR